jgi:AcrR family transcriptional regulator
MRITKEKIFITAMELFKAKGFDATQVSEIAEKAGIGKGTFFNYFPTKQSIFGYLGRMNADELAKALKKGLAEDRPMSEILIDQAKRIAAWCESNSDTIRQAVAAGSFQFAGPGGDSENRSDLRDLLAGIIERGQARGEFRSEVSVRIAALSIEGMYFSIIADWARTQGSSSLASSLDTGIEILFSGMRS